MNGINGINFSIPNQGDISKEHSKEIFAATGLDMEVFKEIVELQRMFNEKIDVAWIQRKFDWNHAMLLESGELLDSIDWKWWKAGKTDWENLEIEMIDLFHFLVAKNIETKNTQIIANLLMGQEVANKDKPTRIKDEQLAKDIQTLMVERFIPNLLNKNDVGAIIAWIEIWYLTGRDVNDLFCIYKMKYVLNTFRQDNGYKDGTYMKMWDGVEDNVVAQELVVNIPNDKDFIDALYKALEERYKTLTIPNEKSFEDFLENDLKWKTFHEMLPNDSKEIITEFIKEFQTYLEK